MSTTLLTPENVAATARSLVNIPYIHQGRTRDGLDCIGVVVFSLLANGWTPQHEDALRTDYKPLADNDMLERIVKGEGIEVTGQEVQLSDLLLFHWQGHEFAQHVGIVSQFRYNRPYFVHTFENARVKEHGLTGDWMARLVGRYRLKDFCNLEDS